MRSLDRRREHPVAVVDIGSNSGRIVVFDIDRRGALEILADERFPLRLIREMNADRQLKASAIERTIRVLRDFRQLAAGTGAFPVIAVATAAVREAANASLFIRRVRREVGLDVQVIDGARESRLAFLGAIYGLPVRHGTLIDIGGGSLQITRFRGRRLKRSWSLPLGALRLSDRFLSSDPPTGGQIRKLRKHLLGVFNNLNLRTMRADEMLVGTGGTIRNLAKIDSRVQEYPIQRLHGYPLHRARLSGWEAYLTSRRLSRMTSLPGLSRDRADSIVGGCIIAESIMELLGAREMLVAGQGLREGLVLEALDLEPPAIDAVRTKSIDDFTARFSCCWTERAERRKEIVSLLCRRLMPETQAEVRELVGHAAVLLDVGRSIDFYRRYRHTAMILRATDLLGFDHRQLLMLSAFVEHAEDDRIDFGRYHPLLHLDDRPIARKAGITLALADSIEHRTAQERSLDLTCEVRMDRVTLRSPSIEHWDPKDLGARFRKAFGRDLVLSGRNAPKKRGSRGVRSGSEVSGFRPSS
jgi:exopolyphosphatase / guanosine-5'-triphosphate,3'-diphosphate pyrophosphatase